MQWVAGVLYAWFDPGRTAAASLALCSAYDVMCTDMHDPSLAILHAHMMGCAHCFLLPARAAALCRPHHMLRRVTHVMGPCRLFKPPITLCSHPVTWLSGGAGAADVGLLSFCVQLTAALSFRKADEPLTLMYGINSIGARLGLWLPGV